MHRFTVIGVPARMAKALDGGAPLFEGPRDSAAVADVAGCFGCARPAGGIYNAACRQCRIRWLARGPLFFEARRTGVIGVGYREALVGIFGDAWAAGHELVKAASLSDQ